MQIIIIALSAAQEVVCLSFKQGYHDQIKLRISLVLYDSQVSQTLFEIYQLLHDSSCINEVRSACAA